MRKLVRILLVVLSNILIISCSFTGKNAMNINDVIIKPKLHPYYNKLGDFCLPRNEATKLYIYIRELENRCD